MWLQTINQASQILHDRETLGYADLIDRQYVFWLKQILEALIIANSADIQQKREAKPGDIKFWHSHIGYLGYRSLKTLKNLCSRMDFKEITSSELCGDCPKRDQTRQPLKSTMSQVIKFLG